MAKPGTFKVGKDPRRGKGGKRPGAGRKTKEEAAVLAKFARNLKKCISQRQQRLIKAYLDFAEVDAAQSRDLISKVLASQVAVVGRDGQPLVPITMQILDANEAWHRKRDEKP